MKLRSLCFLLCCVLTISLLAGCGGKSEEQVASEEVVEQTQDSADKTDATQSDTSATNASNQVKKVFFVTEDDFDSRTGARKNIVDALEQGGYTQGKNMEITEINMKVDNKKSQEVADKVKEVKPDLVIINGSNFVAEVAKLLEGSGIPTLVNLGAEGGFVDESGKPKSNVSGLYTMPKTLQKNAFGLLKQISPINGKKAVFITTEGFFKKEDVEANLKAVGIELKDYCESKFVEDFQASVNKYNNDDEVGWMLVGVWATQKKDGSTFSMGDMGNWDIANRKKPTVTYWEIAVQMGVFCGLGVDLIAGGLQLGSMAVTALNGEKIENMKAQDPAKVNIVLNQKRAKEFNIEFPPDILSSAYRVFTDYEGHYLGQK